MGRDTVKWSAIRDSAFLLAAGAKKPHDTYGAIDWALHRANKHSFLQADAPGAVSELVDGAFGYIHVPQRGGSAVSLADSLQTAIRTLKAAGACGWIVDLRDNGGGNMWPMLAGIGPLLGDSLVGRFAVESDGERWFYRRGVSGLLHGSGVVDTVSSITVAAVDRLDRFECSGGGPDRRGHGQLGRGRRGGVSWPTQRADVRIAHRRLCDGQSRIPVPGRRQHGRDQRVLCRSSRDSVFQPPSAGHADTRSGLGLALRYRIGSGTAAAASWLATQVRVWGRPPGAHARRDGLPEPVRCCRRGGIDDMTSPRGATREWTLWVVAAASALHAVEFAVLACVGSMMPGATFLATHAGRWCSRGAIFFHILPTIAGRAPSSSHPRSTLSDDCGVVTVGARARLRYSSDGVVLGARALSGPAGSGG